MQAVLEKIVRLLNEANGVLTWDELKSLLDFQEQSKMAQAIQYGRSTGALHRNLRYDAENKTNVLTVRLGAKEE